MKIILSDDEACNFARTSLQDRLGVDTVTVELACPTVLKPAYPVFDLNVPMPTAALKHLMVGNWIAAIKEVRTVYGWGLKEAKDYVYYYRDFSFV
jgi:hypothetical protein